jgi:hypothetical protein
VPVELQAVASSSLGSGLSRFAVARTGDGLVASGGGLSTVFGPSGPVVRAGRSRVALSLAAVGRRGHMSMTTSVSPVAVANRVSYRRGSVVEWYRNGPFGLEQGFTIGRRLPGGASPVLLSVTVSGGLRPVLSDGDSVAFRSERGVALQYRGLVATDARGIRLPARLSLRTGRIELRVDDRGARYPLRIDPFVQEAKLVGTGFTGTSLQGWSVALSTDGNTALVGAPYDNNYTGAAWVFTRTGATWAQQGPKLTPADGSGPPGSFFGGSVALSGDGDTALIGGDSDTHGVGAAWVFTRSGSTWSQQGSKILPTGAVGDANWGVSVALSSDGNTALIGGSGDNTGTGAVWVFTRSGSTWSQQGAKLVGTGSAGQSGQGGAVALSGDGNTALIGGAGDNGGAGAVWVFTRSGSTWTQQGPKLVGSDAIGNASQGGSVALSSDGNTALSGGWQDNQRRGAAWVFTRSGPTWSQQGAKLIGTGASNGYAWRGTGVALSGDGNTALVGAPNDSQGWGAAWAFTRSGSTWTQLGEKLVGTAPSNNGNVIQEGYDVALSGDGRTALIGGPDATAISPTGGWVSAGAAWVFSIPTHPTVDSFAPVSGITGSEVTITGTNLSGATSVTFGSMRASFTVASDGEIDATVPNGAVAGRISVTTPAGMATSSQSFTPTLSITSFSPTSGPFGTLVDIKGIGFAPGATVQFNGTATTATFVGSGEVKATVPSTATTGPITLTNSGAPTGTVQSRASYTVTPHVAPTISSFTPTSGITGSKVTITGTYLSGASSVKFGSIAASAFTVYSATQIGVTVPNGAAAGPISVTTAAGTTTSSQSFTPTLSITGFSPAGGPPGTIVVVTGIGFTPGSTVKVNGTAATTTYVSAGKVQATVPAAATTGRISLTNTSAPVGTVLSAKTYTVH